MCRLKRLVEWWAARSLFLKLKLKACTLVPPHYCFGVIYFTDVRRSKNVYVPGIIITNIHHSAIGETLIFNCGIPEVMKDGCERATAKITIYNFILDSIHARWLVGEANTH